MIIRKIVHVDMDAFYASIEQRDEPSIRNKPVAVGGNAERGVIAAASYEARKYGIHSAMSSRIAARLCPHLTFVKPNFEKYKTVSAEIREVFLSYTDLVEPLSLDEAYLDVTENKKGMRSATIIAKAIRNEIFDITGLTASAGISINKFLAKVASGKNKPNGQLLIPPEDAIEFVEKLRVAKFPYIGKKTAEQMYKIGIFHGKDLKKMSLESLIKNFGKQGNYFYKVVRCEQDSPVEPNRIRKSIGAERTYEEDILSFDEIKERIRQIQEIVWDRLKKSNTFGRTLTIKMKTNEFEQVTRSKSSENFIKEFGEMSEIVQELLEEADWPNRPMRLLGISFSNLDTEKEVEEEVERQLTLEF